MYRWVKDNSKMLSEEWLNSGNWKVTVEIPSGFFEEFVDRLNSMTHGSVAVEIEK